MGNMSNVHSKPNDNTDAATIEDLDNATESERDAHLYIVERRQQLDSKLRDRRVITRFTDSQLRFFAQQIFRLANVWILMSVLYVGIMVGVHVGNDLRTSPKSIFFGVVILALAYSVFRVARAAASYIETESQNRMGKLVENFFLMMFAMTIASGILGAAYLITLF